ncbi:MAG: shikimate kinase [Oscillospiraceae bacterium]|nr:shikimate kinase [Oscillospiraceae bacterium]
MQCGLLGEKLGHSYSPQIHRELADYDYRLYEKAPDQVEDFVRHGDWHGLNVTIPYKKTVIPFCDELSEIAAAIGSVNTLLRRADGTIYGDNTDAYGFETLLTGTHPDSIAGQKALVLGTGGASVTVCAVLKKHGAEVVTISRSGENNYENLDRHADAKLLVNTTPVGMFPKNGVSPVDLAAFPALSCVLDVVYNPARTALLLQAEKLGIPHAGGLTMLVAQARRSSEIFLGNVLPDGEILRITKLLSDSMQNIILIGMPGCGKSTVGAILSQRLNRPLLEADAELVKAAGVAIPTIFETEGEAGFRKRETAILAQLGKQSGTVISTGGGCVTRAENYPLLHQNGTIVWLKRGLDMLAREGRPLSLNADLNAMFSVREPLYARFADFVIDNTGTPEETADAILEVLR